MSTQPQILWRDPTWQKEAHEWIRAQAQRQSIQINGEIEQPHVYPWSTVLRVPTNEGTLFFKATAAETIYESRIDAKTGRLVSRLHPRTPRSGYDSAAGC